MAGNERPVPDIPDPILAAQWASSLAAPTNGEHRLMFAILIDAINLASREQPKRQEYQDAVEWLFSDVGETTYGWSFLKICAELDLNPVRLRKQIAGLDELDLRGKTNRSGDNGRRIVLIEREAIQ
jgi:hypothetical protein